MTYEVQKSSMPATPPKQEGPPILHVFERALRDVSMPIERVREIYQLQREIEFDLAEREYIRVRGLMEQELAPVAKDASNPQTRSKYASLPAVIAAVRPVYSKHGVVIEFDTAPSPLGDTWIRVLAFLSHEGGYKRTFHVDMAADGKGAQGKDVMTRTHATGSAMTYGRRYLLLNIFNLAVEDDDGNAANRTNGNGNGNGAKLSPAQLEELRGYLQISSDPERAEANLCKSKLRIQSLDDAYASRFDDIKKIVIAWETEMKKARP